MTQPTGTLPLSQIMGEGLVALSSELPAMHGPTRFSTFVEQPQTGQAVVNVLGMFGGVVVGQILREHNSKKHTLLERVIRMNPDKKAREDDMVAVGSTVGGTLIATAAMLAMRSAADRSKRHGAARTAYQVLSCAAAVDGVINDANQAMLSAVLDCFGVSRTSRTRIRGGAVPTLGDLQDCNLEPDQATTLATFAYYASANEHGPQVATEKALPIFIRLGKSPSEAAQLAEQARAGYEDDSQGLSDHYRALAASVGGAMQELRLPHEAIESATATVLRYDPHAATRQRNADILARAVRAGESVFPLVPAGPVKSALGIAGTVTSLLIGRSPSIRRSDVDAALALHNITTAGSPKALGPRTGVTRRR